MNSGSGFRWKFWPLFSGLTGLALVLAYALRHPEVLAVREALVCQWQAFASDWPGWGMFFPALGRHAMALAVSSAIILLSWIYGSAALRLFKRNNGGILLPAGLGLGLTAFTVYGAGLLGLFSRAGFALAGAALAVGAFRHGLPKLPPFAVPRPRKLLVFVLAFIFTDLLLCLYPEWYLDGLAWHLGLPERYLMAHKVVIMDYFVFSFVPMLGEMLYGIALAFGGEEGAKMVNLGCGVLAAFSAGRLVLIIDAGNKTGALLAVLAFVSMPMAHLQNGTAFIDNLRTLLELLAVAEIARLWNGGSGNPVIPGALMGLAFGAKYLSGPPAMLFAASFLAMSRRPVRDRLKSALIFLSVFTAVSIPWLARAWFQGGDPFYPMGPGWLAHLGMGRDELAVWVAESRHFGAGEQTLGWWLALPWNFFMDPMVGHYGSYTAGPLALFFIILLAGTAAWNPVSAFLLGICALEWLMWTFTSQIGRYLMPMVAILFALGGWSAGRNARASRVAVAVVLAWACLAMVLRFNHRCNLYQSHSMAGYTLGRLDDGAMREARGFGEKAMAGLPPGRLLLWGDIPPLGSGRTWVGSSGFNHPIVKTWAGASDSLRRFRIKLRQSGVRGMALSVEAADLQARRGPGYSLNARESRLVSGWMATLQRTGSTPRFVFYSIPLYR